MIPNGAKVAIVILNEDCTKVALLKEGTVPPSTSINNGESFQEAAKRLMDDLNVRYTTEPVFVRFISFSSQDNVGNYYVMATKSRRVLCPSEYIWYDVESFYNPFGDADNYYQLALILEAERCLKRK